MRDTRLLAKIGDTFSELYPYWGIESSIRIVLFKTRNSNIELILESNRIVQLEHFATKTFPANDWIKLT